ncbi:MAG: IS1 family transposase [Flavobacteriales bacterium]
MLKCRFCKGLCVKNGKDSIGVQKYKCNGCGKNQREAYRYRAYVLDLEKEIVKCIRNGVGMRGMSNITEVSVNTLKKRILSMSKNLNSGIIPMGKTYQVDELKTYISNKKNECWVAYAYCEETKGVVDIAVGRRTNKVLKRLIETLVLSEAKKIKTDKLNNYQSLVPKELHVVKSFGINHIERKNLTLRTHIKRLSRKTICYSKSLAMLQAIVKIYFWSGNIKEGDANRIAA